MEYYIESNQDPDFNENDFMYEDLYMDELDDGK